MTTRISRVRQGHFVQYLLEQETEHALESGTSPHPAYPGVTLDLALLACCSLAWSPPTEPYRPVVDDIPRLA